MRILLSCSCHRFFFIFDMSIFWSCILEGLLFCVAEPAYNPPEQAPAPAGGMMGVRNILNFDLMSSQKYDLKNE